MTDDGDLREGLGEDYPLRILRTFLNFAANPEIQACIKDAQDVLSFDLPDSECQAFLIVHNFITYSQLDFITEWRASPSGERRYLSLLGALNGTMREAYACVLYHFRRLSDLEAEVMERISKRNYREALGNGSVGIGNTVIWDFEYQAFVMAYRRCLDYLTRGLATFFKHEFHSFRDLPKKMENLKPQNVATALVGVHARHSRNFSFVITAGNTKSVRDQIAHYHPVSVGTINLSRHGFILFGGAEDLSASNEHNHDKARLTEALVQRVRMLKDCIDEMLTVFVNEARAWDATRVP